MKVELIPGLEAEWVRDKRVFKLWIGKEHMGFELPEFQDPPDVSTLAGPLFASQAFSGLDHQRRFTHYGAVCDFIRTRVGSDKEAMFTKKYPAFDKSIPRFCQYCGERLNECKCGGE